MKIWKWSLHLLTGRRLKELLSKKENEGRLFAQAQLEVLRQRNFNLEEVVLLLKGGKVKVKGDRELTTREVKKIRKEGFKREKG